MPTLTPATIMRSAATTSAAVLLFATVSACRDQSATQPPGVTHPGGVIALHTLLSGGPFSVAVSRLGVVYVARHYIDLLSRFDLPSLAATGSLPTGRDPVEVVFVPSGATAYVTHQFNDNVGVVDVASGAITRLIPVSGNPWRVRASRDGSRLFVTSNTGVVSIIDANTRTVVDSIPLGVELNGIALQPTGNTVYLTSFTTGLLFAADLQTRDVKVLNTGGRPQDVALTTAGDEMWIANEQGWVEVREPYTGKLLQTVPVSGGAFGLAISPDNAQVWVTLTNAGTVVVLDRVSRTVVRTIATGGAPRRIAFDAQGTTAVIGNESGWADFVR